MKRFVLWLIMAVFVMTSTAQSPTYRVYAIRFAGSSYPFTIRDWVEGGPSEKADITFMLWLIRGDNGRNLLVDAGFLKDAEEAAEFQVKDYIRPDSALLRAGIHPGDITDIIVSHPHWDHIDGIGLFPNAKVWMQKDDYTSVMSEPWQKDSSSGGFDKRNMRSLLELNLAGRLNLVNGDGQEILPGIKVHTGSKHTFNSQYVVVASQSNNVVIASDNVWLYYQLDHLAAPASGGTLEPAGYILQMKKMKSLVKENKYILPGHDGQVFTLFPRVSEGIVEIK